MTRSQDLIHRPEENPVQEGTKPQTSIRGWWAVAYLTACALVAYTSVLSINLLVDPIQKTLGIGDVQFSFLQGLAYVAPVTVSGIVSGFLADRLPKRRILALGLVIWGFGTISCGLAHSFWQLVAARSMIGLGKGALVPVAVMMVAQSFSPEKRGRAMGVFFVGLGVGPGIGLWSVGLVYDAIVRLQDSGVWEFGGMDAWRVVFFAVGLPAFLLLAVLFSIHEPRSPAEEKHPGESGIGRGTWVFFAALFFGLILITFTDNSAIAWIPTVFIREFGFSLSSAGAAFAGIAITGGILGPLVGGWVGDIAFKRHGISGRLEVCMLASLMLSVLYLGVLLWSHYAIIAVLVLVAILVMTVGSVGMVIVQDFLPERLRGLGTGVTYSLGLLFAGNGPTAVALANRYLYGDSHTSLAIATICVPASLLSATMLFLALRIGKSRALGHTLTKAEEA